jgi:NAD(P)-dependent dehydrogenase (short-subunit alcohol dehydrogenase family)
MGIAVARRLGVSSDLLIADIDGPKLETQVAALLAEGVRVDSVICDVSDAASVQGLAERVRARGGFRKLAHVVGLSPGMADWRRLVGVNLIGPALVTQALLPLAKPGAAAVLIASIAAHLRAPDPDIIPLLDNPLSDDFLDALDEANGGAMTPQLAYTLSKFAVVRMAQRLGISWGSSGARIVSVSPGLIASAQGEAEFKNSPNKFTYLEKCPLQRQGTLQEVAEVVEFLLSERAAYVNGIDLLVDGGLSSALRHDRTRP